VRLSKPLVKLPIRFCAETLAAEVRALPREAWVPHPQKFEGNDYVPLITPGGAITNEFAGPMGMTPFLRQCPYTMEAMAALDGVWGRSRLMGLGPGGSVPEHIDINYYWRTHVRVHIPITTNAEVEFRVGGDTAHMAPGECWVIDTFQSHEVHNRGQEQRVHLVLDTVGSEKLWDAVGAATAMGEAQFVEPGAFAGRPVRIEQTNYPAVMSPWEMQAHFDYLLDQAVDAPPLEQVRQRLGRLISGWAAAWAEFADSPSGVPTYRALIAATQRDLDRIGGHSIMLTNERSLYLVLHGFIFDNAIESERVRASKAAAVSTGRRLAS
jgi:hypothetical protein